MFVGALMGPHRTQSQTIWLGYKNNTNNMIKKRFQFIRNKIKFTFFSSRTIVSNSSSQWFIFEATDSNLKSFSKKPRMNEKNKVRRNYDEN